MIGPGHVWIQSNSDSQDAEFDHLHAFVFHQSTAQWIASRFRHEQQHRPVGCGQLRYGRHERHSLRRARLRPGWSHRPGGPLGRPLSLSPEERRTRYTNMFHSFPNDSRDFDSMFLFSVSFQNEINRAWSFRLEWQTNDERERQHDQRVAQSSLRSPPSPQSQNARRIRRPADLRGRWPTRGQRRDGGDVVLPTDAASFVWRFAPIHRQPVAQLVETRRLRAQRFHAQLAPAPAKQESGRFKYFASTNAS